MGKAPPEWTGMAIGMMHVLQISHKEVADKMGVTNRYLSMVLNGHRTPPDMESRVNEAIGEILKDRHAKG